MGKFFPELSEGFQRLLGAVEGRSVAVVGHARPDGDCIGSQVALARVLCARGSPAVCVNAPDPPTVNVLPLPTVTAPALAKLPVVVKERLPARSKVPVASLVARFANPLVLFVELRISDAAPVRVILAPLVTMLAPANSRVPLTSKVPAVSLVPEKLVSEPPTAKVLPAPTVRVP